MEGFCMKKIWKKLISVACAACLALGFASCASNDALTAYELAKQQGFTGTEAEWLLSLKGNDGEDGKDLTVDDLYAAAQANGFTGSMLDFLQTLDINVEVKENNDTQTIANNVMSVMSIYCGFSKTTTTGGFFGGQKETSYYAAAGAGVIIDLDKNAGNALIVTNYHVLYDSGSDSGISENIYVYGYGSLLRFSPEPNGEKGSGLQARYVGGAMDYDIALLKVEGKKETLKNATEAQWGNSDTLSLGEKVFAIGNPNGEGIAVTEGVISTESEYIEMTSTDGKRTVDYRVMRTDAAINGGNSGGGLFNAKGELIGITNAKYASEEVDNVGYALPITQVINLCNNIMDNGGTTYQGVVKRAMLGVSVATTASSARIDENGKLQIVEEFAVAEAAGAGSSGYKKFSVGDTFLTMQINDGEKITLTRQYQVNDLLLTVRLGDSVTFEVRNASGDKETVQILFDKQSYFTTYA